MDLTVSVPNFSYLLCFVFSFPWSVVCVLPVVVCFLFLLVSLVGFDILYTFFGVIAISFV